MFVDPPSFEECSVMVFPLIRGNSFSLVNKGQNWTPTFQPEDSKSHILQLFQKAAKQLWKRAFSALHLTPLSL